MSKKQEKRKMLRSIKGIKENGAGLNLEGGKGKKDQNT